MTHSIPRSRSGFALIITVVLVAFLVLILVGLATFTRVETQVADNTVEIAKARQNATNALNLALGQLQRHAGRDERVTARSELVGGIGAGNQGYFTGVWDTTATITGTPTAWLVSGTEGSNSPIAVAGIADPAVAVTRPYDDAAGNVFVVYDESVGSDPADRSRRVRLNKQAITVPAASLPGFASTDASTPIIGNYAYWIGDEGVKASVAAIAPNLTTLNYNNTPGAGGDNWNATLRARLSQFAQPYRRIDEFYPGINYATGSTMAELGRVTNIEQLRFVTNSINDDAVELANFQDRYHEVTPLARGVLARTDDVADTDDRIRSDWSAEAAVASTATTAIRDYWVETPTSEAGFAAVYGIKGRKTNTNYGLSYSVAPVLSEAGLFIKFNPTATGVVLQTALLAEFWNPYAATIQTAAGASLRVIISTGSAGLQFKATDSAATPVEHTISIPATTLIAQAEVPAGQNFSPGVVLHMQSNTSDEFTTGAAGARDSAFNSGTAATGTITACDLPEVVAGNLIIELQENTSGSWVTLQTYSLLKREAETGVSPGAAYAAGYGFELNRDLSIWSDPAGGNARDPRVQTFVAANFEILSQNPGSHWDDDASFSNNPSGLSGEEPFNNGRSIVLFDLRRQEITSVAQLRHLIGNRPYEIMRGSSAANPNDGQVFDETFVSTVPRYHPWNPGTEARPNQYLELYSPPRAPAGEFDSLANIRTSLRSKTNSGRYQLIRGAFNVNSTSVEAWSAVLGSSLANWDTEDDVATNVNRAFFRTPHGAQEKGLANLVITDITGDTPSAPAGADLDDDSALDAIGRRLTATQIATLAQDIVDELITRGRPFASLGDFAASNVLSAAITASGVNNDITTAGYRYSSGALTQGDIIASIAPFMSARSDTFKIRAYGDSVNPVTGEVTGRAWCEAIVQRLPDLAPSPAQPNAAAAAVGVVLVANPTIYTFGRQFKIVSFRWLNPDDI